MMRAILNSMRMQAMRATANIVSSRVGQITSYNPANFTARVTCQPDDVKTGWLPIGSPWIGNGWGLVAPPNIGDMVTVDYVNGDLEAGVVVARLWNLEDTPPNVPSGEFWIVHAKGGFFKLTNDGKVSFDDGNGASVILNGDGTISSAGSWTHDGTLTVTDDATFQKDVQVDQTLTATTDVVGGAEEISLVDHAHTSESPGSPTSPPLP